MRQATNKGIGEEQEVLPIDSQELDFMAIEPPCCCQRKIDYQEDPHGYAKAQLKIEPWIEEDKTDPLKQKSDPKPGGALGQENPMSNGGNSGQGEWRVPLRGGLARAYLSTPRWKYCRVNTMRPGRTHCGPEDYPESYGRNYSMPTGSDGTGSKKALQGSGCTH